MNVLLDTEAEYGLSDIDARYQTLKRRRLDVQSTPNPVFELSSPHLFWALFLGMILVMMCTIRARKFFLIPLIFYLAVVLAIMAWLFMRTVFERRSYMAWVMSFYDTGDDIPPTSLTLDFIKRCLTLLYETPTTWISQLRNLRRVRRHDTEDVEMIL